ncbi:MAG: DoxX family protein [Armatimonadota bacterium]
MRNLEVFFQRWSPYMLSVLRIMTAALFIQHGGQKILGFPPGGHQIPLDQLFTLSGIGALLELVGGALLLLGLGTRFTAFILSGEMAVAYFIAHAPRDFFPLVNRGELAVLYCFVFLYFVFAGAGPISLDALFRRKAKSAEVKQEAGSAV